ncbi:MAG: DUF433 domain-containing protein [Acidobacteria bacterium]|nr:DUF433 domain-containing protein [Acidobacteriota bacterium]
MHRPSRACLHALVTLRALSVRRSVRLQPDRLGGRPRVRGRRITVQNIAIWHERLAVAGERVDRRSCRRRDSVQECRASVCPRFAESVRWTLGHLARPLSHRRPMGGEPRRAPAGEIADGT